MPQPDGDEIVIGLLGRRYRSHRRRRLVRLAAAMLVVGFALFQAEHGQRTPWLVVAFLSSLVAGFTFRRLAQARKARGIAERVALRAAAIR